MASFLPPGIAGLLGLGVAPPLVTLNQTVKGWRSRLREAAYKSPRGTRIKFQYTDVSREYDLRGTSFEFPQVNDAYIQRKGFGPRRYPLTCFFSGDDCDLVATAFEAALLEPGSGVLEHPIYGTLRNVVPFGTVTRDDRLATAANQVVIQVTFWTTTGAVYPNSDPATQNELLIQLGNFNVELAQQFAAKMKLGKAPLRAGAIATIKGMLKKVSAAMSAVSNVTTAVRRQMQDGIDLINFGIDTLIGQPLLLAQQISNLVQTPARALAGIESRLDGYSRLATDIFGSSAANPGEKIASGTALLERRDAISNDFHVANLFASSAAAGSMLSAGLRPPSGAPPNFTTRAQALSAGNAIATQYDLLVATTDQGFADLASIADVSDARTDTGESAQALQRLASLTVGFLVQTSFGLKSEQRIILDRDRTIIDLSAELYDSIDDKLDLIISSNDLSGDEILELRSGREIAFYPS